MRKSSFVGILFVFAIGILSAACQTTQVTPAAPAEGPEDWFHKMMWMGKDRALVYIQEKGYAPIPQDEMADLLVSHTLKITGKAYHWVESFSEDGSWEFKSTRTPTGKLHDHEGRWRASDQGYCTVIETSTLPNANKGKSVCKIVLRHPEHGTACFFSTLEQVDCLFETSVSGG